MDEREFLMLADAELGRLEQALDGVLEGGDADFDVELKPGGIIEIACEDGSKIIVNRHTAAREIWVAARSGGFHFRPPEAVGDAWLNTRDGAPLSAVLSRCLSEQAGVSVTLVW